MTKLFIATGLALLCSVAFAADPTSAIGKALDQELKVAESDIVPLVEAMPADKFGFAPSNGSFKNARTFQQQATHSAFVIYAVASAILGEKNPSEAGQSENGPPSIQGKEATVKYLKDAFAYGHKAIATINEKNVTELVASPFGNNKVTRLAMASVAVWHTFDHYGQMVVYARMNGVVPPASK
jgi:hypothetical protein